MDVYRTSVWSCFTAEGIYPEYLLGGVHTGLCTPEQSMWTPDNYVRIQKSRIPISYPTTLVLHNSAALRSIG